MKYIKLFEESSIKKYLNTQEIEDMFLHHIDTEDLIFNNAKSKMGEDWKSNIVFMLSDKFKNIKDVRILSILSNFINDIGGICNRWNLNFEFSVHSGGGYLVKIIQDVPNKIREFCHKIGYNFENLHITEALPKTYDYLDKIGFGSNVYIKVNMVGSDFVIFVPIPKKINDIQRSNLIQVIGDEINEISMCEFSNIINATDVMDYVLFKINY